MCGDDGKVRRDQHNIMRKKKKVGGARVVFNHSPAIGEGELKYDALTFNPSEGINLSALSSLRVNPCKVCEKMKVCYKDPKLWIAFIFILQNRSAIRLAVRVGRFFSSS